LVCWVDAASRGSWQYLNDLDAISNDAHCKSVGFFVSANQDGIFLAGCRNPGEPMLDGWIGVSFIPHGCIYRVKRLRI